VLESLSEYVDETLDPSLRRQVAEHLSTCRGCFAELQEMENYLQAMRSLDEIKAPDDFLEKVHERIEKSSAWRRLYETILLPVRMKIPLEVAGVAIAALLVVCLYQGILPEKRVPVKSRAPLARHPESSEQTGEKEQKIASEESQELPQAARTVPPETGAMIELSLLMDREPQSYGRKSKHEDAATTTLSQTETANLRSGVAETRPQQHEPREKRAAAPVRTPAKSPPTSGGETAAMEDQDLTEHVPNLILIISRYVQRAGGKLHAVETQSETGRLDYVIVEVPATDYALFLNDLRQVGEVNLLEDPVSVEESSVVRLRINLVYASQSQ